MTLDVETLMIISAVAPFGMGILMMIYLFQRKVYPGFGRWVLANFMFSLGFFSIALRGHIPDILSIVLGNSFIVYSEILVYEGIECYFGRAPFRISNYLILTVYILIQSYLTYIDPNTNMRIVLISAALFILIGRAGFALLNSNLPKLSKTTRSAAALFFFSAFVPFLRAIYTLLQTKPVDLFTDVMGAWSSMVILVAIIAWTFYYFFLTSARLESELQSAHEEMTQFAVTDFLTELHNRRYFLQQGQNEFERSKRNGLTFSIFFIDLDDLKTINDQFGHNTGDMALMHVARIIKSEVRPYDLAARFGGDEFVLLLCNVNKEQASYIAERIRSTAEQFIFVMESQQIPIRLSLGVTSLNAEDMELNQILQRADTALYKAKNDGRNRTIIT